jgi:hypothetical protein
VLSIGSVPPPWTGTRLDGGTFSTDDLAGQPSALLIWCSCVPGPQPRLFAEAAKARRDVGFAMVSVDLEGTTRDLVAQLGIGMPVVLDPQQELVTAWGLDGFPALVLLRGDGSVADVQPQTFDEAKLGSLLDALVAGRAIPDPVVPSPAPTDAAGRSVDTTVLERGAPAPVLSGALLGGGERSTADLRGRPLVVLFWLPPRRDGTPLDDTPLPGPFIDAIARSDTGVRLLLVAGAEAEVGDARHYLDGIGWDGEVIADWSGEWDRAWGLTYTPSVVVLDAGGRVVRVAGGPEALSDPGAILDAIASPTTAP